MNYDELSDFQINKAVAEALGRKTWYEEKRHGYYRKDHPHAVWAGLADGGGHYMPFDYCNKPGDSWPIILENRITILPDGSEWAATDHCIWKSGVNPLRCAMIVFLETQKQSDDEESNP